MANADGPKSTEFHGKQCDFPTVGFKLGGVVGLAAAGVLAYIENPFGEDVLVVDLMVHITTLDATDGDIDVGLADDAAATNIGNEFIDSLVNSAVAFFKSSEADAAAGSTHHIWKAEDNATDSFIVVYQNTAADCTDLVMDIYITGVRAVTG